MKKGVPAKAGTPFYILPVYDPEAEGVNNVIVFAKGTIDKPIITSIIEIDCYNETELDKIRRKIYDLGRRSIQQKIGKFIRRYDASVFQYHDDRGKRESRRYDYGNFVRGGNSQQIKGDTRKRTAIGREQYRNPLSNGFGGRQNGESIFKRSQKVDGRSIYYRERPSIAFERRKYCKTLRDTGNTEQRIIYGHKCEVIPKEHYTDRMSKIAAGNAKDGFDETIFITGGAVIPFAKDAKGDPKTAKGVFIKADGKKIAIIQYDHSFMPEQINDHEKVHNRYDSDLTQKIKKILLNSLTKREKQAILEKLSRDYNGTPFVKQPIELISGLNFYPSLSQPRAIRDKWQHFFNSLGVDDIYNELSGKPTKGIGEVVKGAFLYNYDYKESAYYEILDIKREFQKKNDNTIYGADKKSNGLYYMKQAVRYKNKKAALKYLEEYFNNGGTVRGIKQSFTTLNPMFGFTGKETIAKDEEFIASLTEEQKEKLKIAQDFYENDLMLPETVLAKLGQQGITDDQAKNVLKNYIASKCE